MAFANPSLAAEAYRPWTSFFSLPMGGRGQGKEMSFFQKTLLNVPFEEILHKLSEITALQQVIRKNAHKKQEVERL